MRWELSVLVAAMYVGVAFGQNDILKEKWGLVFDHRNLVKEVDEFGGQVINFKDYQAMKKNLIDSNTFRSVANDLAGAFYSKRIKNPKSKVAISREIAIYSMGQYWKKKKSRKKWYDGWYYHVTNVTEAPLNRDTFVECELAVGAMDAADAGEAFDKMMEYLGNSGAQSVSQADYTNAYLTYFEDGTVSAEVLPLFGPPSKGCPCLALRQSAAPVWPSVKAMSLFG